MVEKNMFGWYVGLPGISLGIETSVNDALTPRDVSAQGDEFECLRVNSGEPQPSSVIERGPTHIKFRLDD